MPSKSLHEVYANNPTIEPDGELPIELSVIVPVYNEQDNLDYLFQRLLAVLDQIATPYEVICINDGSKDDTLKRLLDYHCQYPAIKIVNLSRNFGKEIALSAGLDYTNGAAVIIIDADLQDPPELIHELLPKWREGYDVVYATRRSRAGESWLKRSTAFGFYQVLNLISDVVIPHNTGDFRLLDRRVVEALRQIPERNRFMKGLFSWVGYKQTAVVFDRPPRHRGSSSWNYWKLWNFALEGFTSFSFMPLKIWSYLGLAIAIPAFFYASYLILRTMILGIDVPGYASLMVAILFFGGIQLISLGVIGEYLGRIYQEVKGRPLYFVRDVYGFGEKEKEVEGGKGR